MRCPVRTMLLAGLSLWMAVHACPVGAQGVPHPTVQYHVTSPASGLCWDVPNANISVGQQIQQFFCHTRFNQKWTFEGSGSTATPPMALIHVANDPRFCVASSNDGRLVLALCVSGAVNQLWRLHPPPLTGIQPRYAMGAMQQADKCIDIPSGVDAPNPLFVGPCNGGANQQWILFRSE